MKILIVDNYDSFTYNLLHQVRTLLNANDSVDVVKNDRIVFSEIEQYRKIILSPGPGLPSEAGRLPELIDRLKETKPILGVCLGMQAIGEAFGAKLIHSGRVFHGISSEIEMRGGSYVFNGLPRKIEVGRYHSWLLDPEGFPECLEITAADQNGQIMAISHKTFDLHGVQFHPESFLTPDGEKIVNNFINAG